MEKATKQLIAHSLLIVFLMPVIYVNCLRIVGLFVRNPRTFGPGPFFGTAFVLTVMAIFAIFYYLGQPFRQKEKFKRLERPFMVVIVVLAVLQAVIFYAFTLAAGSALSSID